MFPTCVSTQTCNKQSLTKNFLVFHIHWGKSRYFSWHLFFLYGSMFCSVMTFRHHRTSPSYEVNITVKPHLLICVLTPQRVVTGGQSNSNCQYYSNRVDLCNWLIGFRTLGNIVLEPPLGRTCTASLQKTIFILAGKCI